MPVEALTDARVKAVKPPQTGIFELWDDKSPGLCLRVMASGVRSWSYRYRPRGGGAFRRITFGKYPALGLSDARDRADALRVAIRAGADPQHEDRVQVATRREEEKRATLSIDQLADHYVERYAKKNKTSWQNDDGYLRRHVRPAWGSRLANAITKQDVARLLGEVKDRTPVGANRTRSVLVKFFGWAVDEGLPRPQPDAGRQETPPRG